jgi:hypothetical protein
VGVMRRAEQDIVVESPEGQPPTLIPAGWDIWLYFVAGATTLHTIADKFVPERFISKLPPSQGMRLARAQNRVLRGTWLDRLSARWQARAGWEFRGRRVGQGGWSAGLAGLGYGGECGGLCEDLKQLPCQRPKDPILVRIDRGL